MALFWQAVVWLCIGMLAYTYLGYPLLMYLLAKLRRRFAPGNTLPATNHRDWPFVNFLIPAYNEQNIIREKVENTLHLDYPRDRLRITVVSDGSTDQTNAMLASYGENEIHFIALPRRQGKTKVLNQIIPTLPGEIIVLSDASGLLQPDALKKLVRHFSDPRVGCVSGVYMFETDDNSLRSMTERLYWKYETFLKTYESRVHSVIGAHGALYAFRRTLFVPLDQKAINDDFIVPMQIIRQGYRVHYEPEAVVSERESTSLPGEFQRRIRINVGNFQMIYVLRSLLNPRRGLVALQFISHKVLRTISPAFILLLPPACLLAEAPLYRLMLGLQAAFYLIGVLGYVQEFFGLRISYLYMPFYFLMGNVAAVFGFVRFILRKQSILWRRV
ncbi:MAG: glycosyltransferase family 2 protein [candidate division KSB1 bacterium]|nr:glycosyltransferase family 2 protein [candidate division KSB1 bacterium]MDZ7273631.1 glycosyltransferase family 2 protein [candidate division KSB1 bacterium]MDZ7286778.1 glycosyltransferase family 2 protein [candidate division KSB1 bacterium]MDZ7299865.1 glycosyltransferase family 2 protein [candidate division KSB1 bacterium]MDZ7305802.1 glycosyltransferase family 2 protein [candidate division KSB1 bacterium]